MIRPDCSYWITVHDNKQPVWAYFQKNPDTEDLFDCEEVSENKCRLSLKEGAIEQTQEIEDACRRLSEERNCMIEYEEINEEPFSPDVKIIFDCGKTKTVQQSRVVDGGKADAVTVHLCMDAIRAAGLPPDTASQVLSILQTLDETEKIRKPCCAYRTGNPIDGYDYDCEYEKAPDDCGSCMCNGGRIDPETGRTLPRSAQCILQAEEENLLAVQTLNGKTVTNRK